MSTQFKKSNNNIVQRRQITVMVMAVLTVILAILLIILIAVNIGNKQGNGKEDDTSGNSIINSQDISYTTMTVSAADTKKGNLVLVNATHEYSFPETNNRIAIWKYRKDHSAGTNAYKLGSTMLELEAEATEALHNMFTKLYKDTGKSDLNITSAYRSYEEQAALNSSSIKAGFSDSHTGLSFAASIYENNVTSQLTDDANKVYYDWLVAHAHEFGYIIRYPSDKEASTGISNYTNAFRYVGIAHATYMHNNNLCLEEYIDFLKSNASFDNKISINCANGKAYIVYYVPSSGDITEIKVPSGETNPDGTAKYPYTLSGTNDGGIVVTIQLN